MPRNLTTQLVALRLLITGVLLAAAHSAQAQYQVQTVALSVGPTLPRGDLADTLRSGINVTASVGFHFGESFTLRGEGMYQQLGRKLSAPPGNNQMVLVGGAAEIGFLGAKGPYVLGGYGFYQTLKSGSVPASAWQRGYSFGGGWRLAFERLSLFGEARLHRVHGERAPVMLPISFGIRI
jgi:hypothetical protein